MRILVTGHQGYIGSVMTRYLAAEGHEVVGLDTAFFGDCVFGQHDDPTPSIQKDVRDVTAEDLQGFDAVAHLAALANDPLGDLNPDWTYDINHRASVHLARTAKAAGVKRFVFSSSCSMYGDGWKDELLSEDAPMRPLTPYAVSKAKAEEDIAELADRHFTPVYMRNGSAYGISSHLRADLVLNNLMGWALTTGKIKILSDGSPWRPIVHVEDISMAFAQALTAPKAAVHNQAFNVGPDGENYQVRDLAGIVNELLPEATVEYVGKNPDPRNYRVSFAKIHAALPGFQPKWNARLGARQLLDGYRAAGLTAETFQGPSYTRLLQLKALLAAGRLDGSLRWKVLVTA
ncbi:MAG: SDR family oxidoreductase [Chloroflexi bacterium]|nr:MAG: SDR family oxidoreductase [Chloroflexota bacterium]